MSLKMREIKGKLHFGELKFRRRTTPLDPDWRDDGHHEVSCARAFLLSLRLCIRIFVRFACCICRATTVSTKFHEHVHFHFHCVYASVFFRVMRVVYAERKINVVYHAYNQHTLTWAIDVYTYVGTCA